MEKKSKLESYPYQGMNEQQILVINKLTRFRAAKELEKQVGDLIHKDVKDEFYYAGYKDTGYMGGDHCSKGHSLRYVHFAKNRETGEEIKFGIKCVSDFFNITKDQLKLLQDGFVQTNKIVDQIIERFRKGDYNFEKITNQFLAVKNKINNKEVIANLLYVYLPLPYIYEKEICMAYEKHENQIQFEKYLNEHPKEAGILVMAKLCQDDYLQKNHMAIDKKINDIFKWLDDKGKLTDAQIKFLEKLGSINYNEIDNILADLNIVDPNKFKRTSTYNERLVYLDLQKSYNEYGLTINQINLLKKIHTNLKNEIELSKQSLLQII